MIVHGKSILLIHNCVLTLCPTKKRMTELDSNSVEFSVQFEATDVEHGTVCILMIIEQLLDTDTDGASRSSS